MSGIAKYFHAHRSANHIHRYLRDTPLAMRVVDPESERDDARRSELIEHEPGCWSIFSGKIISACKIAEKLATRVETLDKS